MPVCTFCSKETLPGRGVKVFRKDGSSRYFCSNKCASNNALGRRSADLKWISRKEKQTKRVASASPAK